MGRARIRDRGVATLLAAVLCVVIAVNIRKRLLYAELSKAVYAGDATAIASLIKKDALPAPKSELLVWALQQHRQDIAAQLLKAGAKPAAFALSLAVELDETESALLLLKSGADVNTGSVSGGVDEPLLYAAVKNGNVAIVSALIAHHAPLNKKYEINGVTPLHLAAMQNDPTSAKILLQAGADPNLPDSLQNTPLTSAIKSGNQEIVRLLLANHADIDQKGLQGYTPLLTACAQGDTEVANYLLERRANFSMANEEGLTPLQAARRFPEITEALRKAGAR